MFLDDCILPDKVGILHGFQHWPAWCLLSTGNYDEICRSFLMIFSGGFSDARSHATGSPMLILTMGMNVSKVGLHLRLIGLIRCTPDHKLLVQHTTCRLRNILSLPDSRGADITATTLRAVNCARERPRALASQICMPSRCRVTDPSVDRSASFSRHMRRKVFHHLLSQPTWT